MSHGCVTVQLLTFSFASTIFRTQLLQRSDLYNECFRQFCGVRLKAFDVAVMVRRPKAGSSEGDVEEPLLHPSLRRHPPWWT